MAFHLAHSCGQMNDVDEMLDAMTPQQFDEVLAFNSLHPISGEPDRRLLVLIATLLVNQHSEKPVTENQIREFAGLPSDDPEESDSAAASPEAAAAYFKALTAR